MPRIVLTEEQARLLAESKGRVEVYDMQGRLMCFMDWLGTPLEEIIAECKRRQASGNLVSLGRKFSSLAQARRDPPAQRDGRSQDAGLASPHARRGGGMKSYTVDWEPEAENDLTAIWLRTSDPAVTMAQDEIDDLLERNPIGYGLLLSEGLYQIVFVPLTAFYSIDQAKKIVKISAVWYTP